MRGPLQRWRKGGQCLAALAALPAAPTRHRREIAPSPRGRLAASLVLPVPPGPVSVSSRKSSRDSSSLSSASSRSRPTNGVCGIGRFDSFRLLSGGNSLSSAADRFREPLLYPLSYGARQERSAPGYG